MAKVKHQVGIDGTIEQVFSTLTTNEGFAGWWASSATISPEIGGKIALTFDNLTTLYFEYQDILENEKVAILCTGGTGAWQDSELLFELVQASDQVYLTLTHTNEASSEDEFLYFSTKWTCYLLSLRDFVETGRGRPYPNDIKIHVGD
ncbi:SRPBCC domain-containing protein [Thalassomonas sp. RHCl1]|uniref:SRPBCC family protein n=1 Tax=Thalassomonas sp. RHCl1 TaxID=2995320 RepID=UPI00248D26E1|nr:SRPBCC domain-containing protein [Thalassomonas sp. RHCl1]